MFELPPGWKRLSDAYKIGKGLLWDQIADFLRKGLKPEEFWKLCVVNNISVACIPPDTLWDTLSVSLKDEKGSRWILVRDLGEISLSESENDTFTIRNKEGATIGPDKKLDEWEGQGEARPSLSWQMGSIVLLMSCLEVREDKVILKPQSPDDSPIPLVQYAYDSRLGVSSIYLDYVGDASKAIAIETAFPTANRNHELVKISLKSRYISKLTELETFARSFVSCIADTVSTKKQTPSLDTTNYWQKRVGHLYFSVPWEKYNATLKPPYHLWTKGKGWFLFGEEEFAKWRDAPASAE